MKTCWSAPAVCALPEKRARTPRPTPRIQGTVGVSTCLTDGGVLFKFLYFRFSPSRDRENGLPGRPHRCRRAPRDAGERPGRRGRRGRRGSRPAVLPGFSETVLSMPGGVKQLKTRPSPEYTVKLSPTAAQKALATNFLVGATRLPRRPRRLGPLARVAGHPLAPAAPSGEAVCATHVPRLWKK